MDGLVFDFTKDSSTGGAALKPWLVGQRHRNPKRRGCSFQSVVKNMGVWHHKAFAILDRSFVAPGNPLPAVVLIVGRLSYAFMVLGLMIFPP